MKNITTYTIASTMDDFVKEQIQNAATDLLNAYDDVYITTPSIYITTPSIEDSMKVLEKDLVDLINLMAGKYTINGLLIVLVRDKIHEICRRAYDINHKLDEQRFNPVVCQLYDSIRIDRTC